MPDSAIAVKSPATRAVSFLKISLPSTGSSSYAPRTRHAPTDALYTNLEPRRNAAVDRPCAAGDETCALGGQKCGHRGDLRRCAHAAQRDLGNARFEHLGLGLAGLGHGVADVLVVALGAHRGGHDGVDQDAV